jgi:FtsP/CotA-like multicopper oxidase with cupredoxin domain
MNDDASSCPRPDHDRDRDRDRQPNRGRRHLVGPLLASAGLTLAAAGCGSDGTAASSTTAAATANSSTISSSTATSTSPTTASSTTASSTTAAGARTTIEASVTGKKVTVASDRFKIMQGSEVTIRVTTDSPQNIHLHGYDIETEAGPGAPAEINFTASNPGVYEVELEDSSTPLFEIEVS